MENKDDFFTTSQAAKELGLHEVRLRQWARNPDHWLRPVKREGNHWLWDKKEVLSYAGK